MARSMDRLPAQLQREYREVHSQSKEGRGWALFLHETKWSSSSVSQTPPGGNRGFDSHVRIGGHMARPEVHVRQYPKDDQQDDEGESWGLKVNTGVIPSVGRRKYAS